MRRRQLTLMLGVGAVAVAATAVEVATAGPSSAGVSVRQAARLVRAATEVSQQVVVPSAAAARSGTVHPRAADLAAMREIGQTRLSAYYTGKALQQQLSELDRAVNQEQQPDFVALGGGASNFVVVSTHSLGSGLFVRARVDVWSLVGQIQGNKVVEARPSNTILVTATVAPTSAGPRISSYSWRFAPGSSP